VLNARWRNGDRAAVSLINPEGRDADAWLVSDDVARWQGDELRGDTVLARR
jgi:hypothetical protein